MGLEPREYPSSLPVPNRQFAIGISRNHKTTVVENKPNTYVVKCCFNIAKVHKVSTYTNVFNSKLAPTLIKLRNNLEVCCWLLRFNSLLFNLDNTSQLYCLKWQTFHPVRNQADRHSQQPRGTWEDTRWSASTHEAWALTCTYMAHYSTLRCILIHT